MEETKFACAAAFAGCRRDVMGSLVVLRLVLRRLELFLEVRVEVAAVPFAEAGGIVSRVVGRAVVRLVGCRACSHIVRVVARPAVRRRHVLLRRARYAGARLGQNVVVLAGIAVASAGRGAKRQRQAKRSGEQEAGEDRLPLRLL